MQIMIKETKVYTFDELSENAKEEVIQWYSETLDGWWSECAIDGLKEVAKLLGIDISNLYFSGFWSQGDGACFEGDYSYAGPNAVATIREEFPKWTAMHDVADALEIAQSLVKDFNISAKVTHSGHHYHEYCTNIDVSIDDDGMDEDGNEIVSQDTFEEMEEQVIEALRDFMRECYSHLEECYEHEVSEENVREIAMANEWLFEEDGSIYH